jgi:predicted acyltransferase
VNQRYYSLDVFRGATVALMILVNNPGTWSFAFSPLKHAPWHGVTPTDLVFPFFLFAVGNAMAFVMPKLQQEGSSVFWKKVMKRTLLIFFIGLFLNWYPFFQWQGSELILRTWTWQKEDGTVAGVRIFGVLQRIALCYFFASIIIYYAKARGAFLVGALFLLLYWALCLIGNPEDPYSLQGWFGTAVDKYVLGEPHMYRGEGVAFDPEGLMSTIPAIAQVIFGFLVGDYIRGSRKEGTENTTLKTDALFQTLTILFIAAVAFLFTGYAWSYSFPINKKIWTSSYVAYTTGLAIMVLSVFIYFIELRKLHGWLGRFFNAFGKNPLFIFALSALVPKSAALIRIPDGVDKNGALSYVSPLTWFYKHVCAHVPGPPENGSLLYALCFVTLLWLIANWMDKKKIYVRV